MKRPVRLLKKVETTAEREEVFKPEAIYFDTNLIIGSGWPTPSAQILEVLNQAEKVGIPVCLPEVVQQELEEHWLRDLAEQWEEANSALARLSKKAHSIAKFDRLPHLPVRAELLSGIRKRSEKFTQRFRIVSRTKRELADFLTMAMQRQAGFGDGGAGFQDVVILCSVLDDMKTHGISAAVLVSNDKRFAIEGAIAAVKAAGVELKVIASLDDLEKLLQSYFSAKIREVFEGERAQLLAAVNTRRDEIERFLVNNLTLTATDLKVVGAVKKVESLRVISIENAHHTIGFGVGGKPKDPDRFKISADVKVALVLDMEQYTAQPQPRLKVGGEVPSTPHDPHDPVATFFAALVSGPSRKEMVVVIEGEARRTENGYDDFQFTGAYPKTDDYGFGRFWRSRSS